MKYLFLISLLFIIFFSFSCGEVGHKEVHIDISSNKYEEHLKQMRQLDNDSLYILADQYTLLLENENQNDSTKAFFYSQLGVIYYQHSLFKPAETNFGKAQDLYSKIGDSTSRTNMLMNRAAMLDIEGQYEKAVAMYLDVIEFYKRTNDSLQLGSSFSNLGVAYEEMEQAGKSLEYHKKALKIRILIHDTLNIAYSYNNIGVVFTELLSQPDSALLYYSRADKIFKNTNSLYQSATVSANIGHIYLDKNDFGKAKINFDFALSIFDSLNIDQGKANMKRSFGQYYFAKGNDKQAIVSLKKSLEINEQLGNKKEILEINKILSKIYIANGNYASATSTMQEITKLNDSLLNIEKQKAIADMETKYQVKEKNKTIGVLRLEEQLHQKQIAVRNYLIALLILVFVLIVSVLYFIQNKNKLNQKQLRLELHNYLLRIDELQVEINEKGDRSKFSEEKLKDFDLSEREIEVLKLIAKGYKNSEIAEKMFVSQNTIKTHIKNIYVKLDVKNRVEALKRVDVI